MARLDVRTIRKKMEQGMSVAEIAKEYGVSRQAVYQRLREDEAKKRGNITGAYALGAVRGRGQGEHRLIDPETGLVIENRGQTAMIVGRMGDERVTEFVKYHMEMMAMREGADKRDITDLRNRFINYLSYCAEHGIVPNNANAYFAMGITKQDISAWHLGSRGTPEHKEFADMVKQFFASIHEQGSTDGVLNPISAMFWQKAYDGLIEASKVEVVQDDPLGEKRSSAEIAAKYADILPEED